MKKLNTPLLKSMLISFTAGALIGNAEKRIAPHRIGRNQTVLRWVAVIGSAVALETVVTAAEKHFNLDEKTGRISALFQ